MTAFLEWIGWIAVVLVLATLVVWLIAAWAHTPDEPIDDE